jgi:ribosomal protein S18 acetylase RimI-like enzyme
MLDRVNEQRKKRLLNQIDIINFQPQHVPLFKKLNEDWITKYFVLEPEDKIILNDPYNHIIKPGGQIKLAIYNGEIVGTCALIKIDDATYELAKMAVLTSHQGLQIGKKLGLEIIEETRLRKGTKIVLESNKKHTSAINLYRSLGFKLSHHYGEKSVFERCDIQMELIIKT